MSLRKISQALTLTGQNTAISTPEDPLSTEPHERQTDPTPDYDALLHKRKGMSGSEFAGVGMQFAITLVLFAFAGVWMDRRLGISPWLTIVMVFAGGALGFWSMYRRMTGRGSKDAPSSDAKQRRKPR
jgi:hypothetical protein